MMLPSGQLQAPAEALLALGLRMALNYFLLKSLAYLAIAAASESGLASAAVIMLVGMFIS